VADDAVSCEPVSAPNFPANREINREFRRIPPSTAIFVSDERADSIAYGGIPYATEQGIFRCVSGKDFQGTGNFNQSIRATNEGGEFNALKRPMSNDGAGIEGEVLHACDAQAC
jgi:hypothetical protein